MGLGHPFLSFQPDEGAHAVRALQFAHGELNPQYFYYAALLWYLLAAVYRLVFWFGRELGLHQSPLDVFSPEIPELHRVLRQSATLVKAFSPYKKGFHPAPLFDRNDAYYFPVGQFSGIVRPGPFVQLYRLD